MASHHGCHRRRLVKHIEIGSFLEGRWSKAFHEMGPDTVGFHGNGAWGTEKLLGKHEVMGEEEEMAEEEGIRKGRDGGKHDSVSGEHFAQVFRDA
jgi:hypothetical protein